MKDSPLVSVVIPVYNGERTTRRAIDSVLNQTYENIELIVVDDASTDRTPEILENISDKRLRVIRHKINLGRDTGGSAARNTGLKASKGDYIALLDSDDEWDLTKLEKQLDRVLEMGDAYKVCSCWVKQNRYGKRVISKCSKEGDLTLEILTMKVSLAFGSSLFFHKDIIRDVGFFDEKFPRHQDYEFVLRIFEKFKLCLVKEPLVTIYTQSRAPSAELLVKTKDLFLNKFKYLIDKFGPNIRKHIYARNWLQVARTYASEGNLNLMLKYLRRSLSYKVLFSDRLKFIPFETYFIIPVLIFRSMFRKE
jgi:glycosyltransferase involved in cell wall biosynthesis